MLVQITGNILKSPDQAKYRRLKLTNNKVRKTIVEVPGAFKLLTSIGLFLTLLQYPTQRVQLPFADTRTAGFQKHISAEGDGYLDLPQSVDASFNHLSVTVNCH